MRPALLVLAVALAGCASDAGGAPLVVGIGAPRPIDLLPDASMLPEGFHDGTTQSQKDSFPHVVDGQSRVLERNNGTERQRVAVGVLLFESPERAQEALRRIVGPMEVERVALGDEAYHQDTPLGHDALGGRSIMVLARSDVYAFWVAHESERAPPAVDVLALAQRMVAQVERE